MRWQIETYHKLERTIKTFLLWPVCINYEYRWLETAYIRQTRALTGRWLNIEWANRLPRSKETIFTEKEKQ
jgi:hypothetical protein